jgi:hypothetical protein
LIKSGNGTKKPEGDKGKKTRQYLFLVDKFYVIFGAFVN